MAHNTNDRLAEALHITCPGGTIFAERSNFEWGYFKGEGLLVDSYLQVPCDVLVIGSGNGREARPICHDGHKIVCMDIGMIYLEIGQKLFAKEGVNSVRFVQADVALLPFKAESFDFVFFSLYSLNGERRFNILSNIRKIIRPGGLLLLSACTPLYERKHPRFSGYTWATSTEQLSQEVSSCGFKLLESEVDPERPEYRFTMLKESGCK